MKFPGAPFLLLILALVVDGFLVLVFVVVVQ